MPPRESNTGNSVSWVIIQPSPVYADGRIYFMSEEGVTTVIAPGKEFRSLATNTLDGWTLASMAISRGSIFIRSQSHLYRIGTHKPNPVATCSANRSLLRIVC